MIVSPYKLCVILLYIDLFSFQISYSMVFFIDLFSFQISYSMVYINFYIVFHPIFSGSPDQKKEATI